MLATDREALICDLAETYGIFDYRALPVSLLATLAVGLRESSRIKMRLSGERATRMEMLLAAAVDRLSLLVWFWSESGENGAARPASILDMILGENHEPADGVETFDSPEQYEEEWRKRTGVGHG